MRNPYDLHSRNEQYRNTAPQEVDIRNPSVMARASQASLTDSGRTIGLAERAAVAPRCGGRPETTMEGVAMTGGKILLVEDNADDTLLTISALRKNGLECGVILARDGEEALWRLLGSAGRVSDAPRLVLLGLHLPKVDGLEVLERLRADVRTRDLPVVLLVPAGGKNGTIADYGGGLADLCIEKVTNFERFVREVGRLKALLSK